ncbi:MAG: DUF3566 domain-containing protein [Actinomycetota bacterium]
MTTTAEEPITEQPAAEPTIDVELQTTPTRRALPSRARVTKPAANRRTRVIVRRFGLLSVFKFALIFSVCLMVVVWLALMLIFLVLQAAGVTDTISYWIGCVINTPEGTKRCVATGIDGVRLFSTLFGAGLVMAVASAILWTFMALIYNLIADIVGGVEVVLAEKRT